MLTMKVRYAIRALTALARCAAYEPVLMRSIANGEGIPERFLSGILLEMRQHGIVQSRKGRNGGYFLCRPASEITLTEIVVALDGRIVSAPCVYPELRSCCASCASFTKCGVRKVLERLQDSITNVLDNITIAQLAVLPPAVGDTQLDNHE